MKILIILIIQLITFMSYSKEFTQDEVERYNYLFNTANELVNPFIRVHNVKPSKTEKTSLLKAITMYDEAISINQESWQSMWMKGKAYQSFDDNIAAYKSFKQAYLLNPENPDVLNEYILEATNLNKFQEALIINEKAVLKHPAHLGLQANYILVLILVGQIENAISQGELVLKLEPDDEITKNLIQLAEEIKLGNRKQPKTISELM